MDLVNQQNPQKELVLTKALCHLAKNFALTGKELSEITGMSESSITRLFQGKKLIVPESKEGEIVLLLIRIYRSLNALLGNQHDKASAWLRSPHRYFQDSPIEAMKTIAGLISVLNYLDAMRGK
jgi:uncharacterized protein (DUF2384 family)